MSTSPIRRSVGARQPTTLQGSVSKHSLLQLGSRGREVKQLQNLLSSRGYLKGKASGNFDAGTARAVRAFQKDNHLQVDGLVGQQTWGSFMGKSYPPGTNLLKSNGVSGPGSSGSGAPATGHSTTDSFEPASGAGKTVTAYVNGQPKQIQVVPVGNGQYLRSDAAAAFKKMEAAAANDGVQLGATSGFRSMGEQQDLYQRYLNGTGNLAAKPGYSNHQDGIAMDISGVGGRGTRADQWLQANAGRFGFRNLPSEFWHYDFVG